MQKGDTLWGIAGRFLKDPWRWPEIWRMNRDQIKNPHRIYPGDVIVLDNGRRAVAPLARADDAGVADGPRLDDRRRGDPLDARQATSSRTSSWPLVTGEDGLANAAEIVAGRGGERVIRGDGDIVYATGIDPKAGDLCVHLPPRPHVARRSTPARCLGYEQRFLGTARVERFAEVSTVRITRRARRS